MSEANIAEMINVGQRFLRSVQLERDFNDPQALDGYVVTPETMNHLKRLGQGLQPDSGRRAWRITGDYGSGKSSFALLLASLVGRPASEIPKVLRPLRSELGLARNSTKLLPVLVTGTREPLARAIVRGLLEAIDDTVDGRRKLSCKKQLQETLKQDTIEDRTAVSLIETSSRELVEQGYFGGVLLILDELGKFLEFAALHPERQDVYFLQLLGEASARSGDAPLYTVGLLHQGLTAYAESLSGSAQREWEKIGGRFEELVFNQPLAQVAILLAEALGLREEQLPRGWKTQAKQDMAESVDLRIYGSGAPKIVLRDLAPRLYPLHSTLIPVLTRFFRRFGQNERSLFSFLLSSEPFALQDFGQGPAVADNVYRLADFYDFAALNFSHRLSGQSFRSHWNHIDAIVRGAESEPEETQRILKTVGILNIIESPELAPTVELLSLALGHPELLADQLTALCKRSILFKRANSGYALWPHSSINLEQAISAANEQVTHAPPIADVVRNRLDRHPIVARRHYIQTGNLRHFDVEFFTANEFEKAASDLCHQHPADGLIAVVLCETVAQQQDATNIANTDVQSAQVLVAVSPPLDSLSGYAKDLERWFWVERNLPELKDDRYAAEEVSRQITTIQNLLESRINELIGFRDARSGAAQILWHHQGQLVELFKDQGYLQTFLSNLCDELFHSAPKVVNELINRHSPSTAAVAARQKLFKAMLLDGDKPLIGLPEDKAPPEKSLYLSVLSQGKIHLKTKGEWDIAIPEAGEEHDPCNLRPAFDSVMKVLESKPDVRIQVSELIEILRSHPFGVRDGLIPILLLTILIVHESEIALYEDGNFSPDIEEFLLQRFAKRPETFEVQLCRITGVRRKLVDQLVTVIEADCAAKNELLSIVRPLCMFVANLPDYAKQTTDLSETAISVRNAIKAAKEPADLVFHAIPEALGIKDGLKSGDAAMGVSKQLQNSLAELRQALPSLHERMANLVLEVFGEDLKTLSQFRESIAETAELVVVGVTDPDLRTFCMKLMDDHSLEPDWLESLGSFLTRCPPSKWTDRHEPTFRERLHDLSGLFNRVLATCFDEAGELPDSTVRVAVTPKTGEEEVHVLKFTHVKACEVNDLGDRLRACLGNDSDVSLAALSQILWEKLQDSK